ncbi:hypothetical protein P692DRAFT_20838705 [Suillus brevipes Sb2]|nr:hypothetical protein P692DRAFT_20838705 [Suillus brevipes Sb2]
MLSHHYSNQPHRHFGPIIKSSCTEPVTICGMCCSVWPLQYVIYFLVIGGSLQSSLPQVISPLRQDSNMGSTATRIIGTLG